MRSHARRSRFDCAAYTVRGGFVQPRQIAYAWIWVSIERWIRYPSRKHWTSIYSYIQGHLSKVRRGRSL